MQRSDLRFLDVNTKLNQIDINKIMLPNEFMGKNLHYVNSANSSSKNEVTLSGKSLESFRRPCQSIVCTLGWAKQDLWGLGAES